ncbi:transglutaminase-like domain-containing protein [Rhodoflexus caldus]|uniref:transglutaminase-like domain-containing protein n=1 Tax=Rhodoflexus caldus TaxID=2891236 RepID=UPI00202A811C|nr:transglutaminase-like domain-containing protein [Rhodoflexus caldus]
MLNPNELKALISLRDDDDPEIRLHVEQKIRELKQSARLLMETDWRSVLQADEQQYIEEMMHQAHFEELLNAFRKWQNEDCDLITGLWLIARYEYPDLQLATLQNTIQQLYVEAWLSFKSDMHPIDQVREFNHIFFTRFRFTSNTTNFTAVSNSMFNQVLETRKGNPISLCVAYMLIARKLGMPIYGVNMPNLFILMYRLDENSSFYINAFNRGRIYSRKDIESYLHQLQLPLRPSFYEPCENIDIVRRMLRNLIVSFDKLGKAAKVEEVKQLLAAISPEESQ